MPRHIETVANAAMGRLLQGMLGSSKVLSENIRILSEGSRLQPDILITGQGRAPVVIEAEYMPALAAEKEASGRLGKIVETTGSPIEAAIALRYPVEVPDAADLDAALREALFSYCVFTDSGDGKMERFPESGWLEGRGEDVADLARLESIPRRAVREAAGSMERGIDRVARILDDANDSYVSMNMEIARLLGMNNVPQTRRMACAIIANAMVFHERVARRHANIKPLNLVCGAGVPDPQREMLEAWTHILDINYWPIFAVGRDILSQMSSFHALRILGTLYATAGEVAATGIDNAHDLTGRVFQRLIADRKYLATFYTLPASAHLLARLGVAKMDGIDWSDPDVIGKLRIGDFACGTGALLSAVYEQIASRHERAGGDPAALHKVMMEEVLYGLDVMPSAVHITGSTLAGAQPSIGFGKSRIYSLPYGRMRDGTVSIGSLELLRTSAQLTQANYTDPARRTGSAGEDTASQVMVEVSDGGFDLVIMNPPFTSDTKHRDAKDGVQNAAFAAFGSSQIDQADMAKRLKRLAKGTTYHGHAGLASAFTALADKKLRPNGIIALVLPFTAINGASWSKFRELISTNYTDITVTSIAGTDEELAFSSDTHMGECLIVGRKLPKDALSDGRASFASLRSKPGSFLEALKVSEEIASSRPMRRLEDGPYGGVPIYCGDTKAGEMVDVPVGNNEVGWSAARLLDASVAQTSHLLSNGLIFLPGSADVQLLAITLLGEIAKRGVHHWQLIDPAMKGAFARAPADDTATYPSLWNHDAQNETKLICMPDSSLEVHVGMESDAKRLWETASRAHITQDFRFTSQALAAAITERATIGGRAWPNISFADRRFESPFALWCNCTLGMIMFWWRASRQQSGRGVMTISEVDSLPMLDFRSLSAEQLSEAEIIFDEFRDRELMPAYLADADPNRAFLDRRVVCDLLGFDGDTYRGVRRLAAKWCAEPSVHGGKERPRSAQYVE